MCVGVGSWPLSYYGNNRVFFVQIRLHYPDRQRGHRKEINGTAVAARFRGPVSTEIFNTLALPLIYIY